MRTITTFLATAGVALTVALGGVPASAVAAADDEQGKLLLMLDASGSMKAKDPSGLTKIEAAKKALTGVVGALPDSAQVGLRVYGAKVDGGGKPTPAACADTQLVSPIGTLDKPKLTSTIAAIQALGETPIAHSLEESMKDLGTTGKRNIVLVSDGEESCVPDPCPVVKKLVADGIDLQIDTVGFGVNATARKQLQCIADAGKGTYYDAKDAAALTTSLSKLSQRALRPFTVDGTRIQGSFDDPTGAPELKPGQYVDTFGGSGREKSRTTGGFETTLHYRVTRTIDGSTPRISVTTRPPGAGQRLGVEGWHLYLKTEEGRQCGQASELSRSEKHRQDIVSVSVAAVPADPTSSTAATDECASAKTLVLTATRLGVGGAVPAEVRYVEEPPVSNTGDLPAAIESIDPKAASPASGTPRAVVGGASFSDSDRLEPGTYVTSVVPGEETFFRVSLDWGQSAVVSVDGPTDRSWYDRNLHDMLHVFGHVHSPDRAPVDTWDGLDSMWVYDTEKPSPPMVNVIPAVNYRNRWSKEAAGFSMAGDYYVSVGLTTEGGGAALAGVPVPIKFSIAVNGTPSGQPAYAEGTKFDPASPISSPSPTVDAKDTTDSSDRDASEEEGSNLLLWLGLGAVVVLGAVGTAYTILRTRRGAHPDGPPTPGV